jgi:hypothetical protein
MAVRHDTVRSIFKEYDGCRRDQQGNFMGKWPMEGEISLYDNVSRTHSLQYSSMDRELARGSTWLKGLSAGHYH